MSNVSSRRRFSNPFELSPLPGGSTKGRGKSKRWTATEQLVGAVLVIVTISIVLTIATSANLTRRQMYSKDWSKQTSTMRLFEKSAREGAASNLYIYATKYHEGMASFIKSIAEILIVARMLNATYVEPCVRHATLISCDPKVAGDNPFRLGDLFDMERIKAFHPHVVSHEAFVAATAGPDTKRFEVCNIKGEPLHWKEFGSHKGDYDCNPQGTNLENFFGHARSQTIEDAVASSRQRVSVFQIGHDKGGTLAGYHRGGWTKMKHNGKLLLPHRWLSFNERYLQVIDVIKLNHLIFHKDHHLMVDRFLEDSGIGVGRPFSAVQWRGERVYKDSLDYVTCANHIVTAKKLMAADLVREGNPTRPSLAAMGGVERVPPEPFVLISAMNRNKSTYRKEGGVEMNADADKFYQTQKALDILMDQDSFLKLDTYQDSYHVRDSIVLAVLDLILSTRATRFATCHYGCNTVCSRCCFQGNFVELTWQLRLRDNLDRGSTTYRCWPVPPGGALYFWTLCVIAGVVACATAWKVMQRGRRQASQQQYHLTR